MERAAKCVTSYMVAATEIQHATEAIVVEDLETPLVLNPQWPRFATVEQCCSDDSRINSAFRLARDFTSRPQWCLEALERSTRKTNSGLHIVNGLARPGEV